MPAQRAAALDCSTVQPNCALQRRLRGSAVCLSSVLVLLGFLFEVLQFVENCLYWIALSAGSASVADLTLSSIGYVAKLADERQCGAG